MLNFSVSNFGFGEKRKGKKKDVKAVFVFQLNE